MLFYHLLNYQFRRNQGHVFCIFFQAIDFVKVNLTLNSWVTQNQGHVFGLKCINYEEIFVVE